MEHEVLIGRIVDDEASSSDRQRFEHLALSEPDLWRHLALRQQDMRALSAEVGRATAAARRVELPHDHHEEPRHTWAFALSGWAAMILVAVCWAIVGRGTPVGPAPGPGNAVTTQASYEESLQSYATAPYVLGQWQPLLLDTTPLSENRVAVRFLRRFEEVVIIDPTTELPVDEAGELTTDPVALRRSEVGFDLPRTD